MLFLRTANKNNYLMIDSAKTGGVTSPCRTRSDNTGNMGYAQTLYKNKGFTLVELSIVLVIIGLIVGGIVGGQSLITAAKVSKQVQQLQKFEVAYNTFQLQYDAVPGDMADAFEYWGVAAGCTNATSAAGCNGNGDGRIHTASWEAKNLSHEGVRFFEHLSRAKLVPEQYKNIWNLGGGFPKLAIDEAKGMIAAGYIYTSGGSHQLSNAAASEKHTAALYLNVATPSANFYDDGDGTISPQQAHTIDKKMDDGAARTGRFKGYRAYNSSQGSCLDSTNGDYQKSNDKTACLATYILE